jgi:hypothetical protein
MKKYLLFVTLILIIGAIVGWTISRSRDPGISQAQTSETESLALVDTAFDSPVANLRLTLNNLLRDHVVMGAMLLTALDQGADVNQLRQLMDENQDELAAEFEAAYGQSARSRFLELWSQHWAESENYTLASKDNRTADMSRARQNLETIAADLGTLFDDQGGNLDGATVTALMTEQINNILALVDAIDMDDPSLSANLIKTASDQAGSLADTLARGLVLDRPDRYNQ